MSNQVFKNQTKKYDNANRGMVVYIQTSPTNVPTGVDTKIGWSSTVLQYDEDELSKIVPYDSTAQTFKIKKDGLYSITVTLRFNQFLTTAGYARAGIYIPSLYGTKPGYAVNEVYLITGQQKSVTTSITVDLKIGDEFYPVAFQSSGADVLVDLSLPYETRCVITRIA